ncbi:MAG TPA: glycosyl hydrolase 108 family protein [Microvirga sp.]|nr:glycosyl hydrolase 108 family protein [Microvirga sp.]
MTATSFPAALALVLRHEGGFADHPLDPGGPTKFGITVATLARWRGRAVGADDVRALGEAEAAAIYRRLYWDAVSADELPDGVDLALFDFAVNAGPTRAARTLQAALGCAVDGAVGPLTVAAARAAPAPATIRALTRARLDHLSRLPTWPVFGKGWRRRVLAVEKAALHRARLAADLPA